VEWEIRLRSSVFQKARITTIVKNALGVVRSQLWGRWSVLMTANRHPRGAEKKGSHSTIEDVQVEGSSPSAWQSDLPGSNYGGGKAPFAFVFPRRKRIGSRRANLPRRTNGGGVCYMSV